MKVFSLRRLFRQSFEGHRGRPGKVGGSLPASYGNYVGKVESTDGNETLEVYQFTGRDRDISRFFNTNEEFSFMVGISGRNRGEVIAATGTAIHSTILEKFDPEDTEENWVRLYNVNREVEANIYFAGQYLDPDFENPTEIRKARGNIEQAKKIVAGIGLRSLKWVYTNSRVL